MNFPCRVTVDLRNHEGGRDYPDSFDETDDMKVAAVVPYELVKPVMELLAWRGAESLPPEMKKDLEELYKACRERYADL